MEVNQSRGLAGIVLRNSLDLKGSAAGKELQQWVYLDQSIKSKIKESLLITLGSSVAVARLTSSQVIAKIASIEIPRQEWQDLIDKLLGNMTRQGASPPLRQATLAALGYVCEEIELEQEKVHGVLIAVVQAMNQAEPSTEVRLAALKALYNVLGAVDFASRDVRSFIMDAVCEILARSEDLEIQQATFECLAKIASTYFIQLQPYLRTILSLTESIAPQCMVFWCTVCKEVIKLREEQRIGSEDCCLPYEILKLQVPVLLKHLFKREKDQEGLVRMLLQHLFNQEEDQEGLVPMPLEHLLMQEEDQEGDDFMQEKDQEGDDCLLNIDIDCVTFLGLIARTIRDAIVPLVMQCIEGNIKAPDWHSRMAAVSAIGFILEGPSVKGLAPLLDLLLDKMKDPNSEVKGTTAWILGRMFKLLHFPASANGIITKANLPRTMDVLVHSSQDIPIVSEKVCGAIYFLARGYEDAELMPSELSSSVDSVIDALLSASQPSDETPFRLGASAYEALCAVVRVGNMQQPVISGAIGNLMHHIMKRLDMTLDRQALPLGHKLKKNNLQIVLCGVLQVIIEKLASSATVKIVTNAAHHLLFSFCRVLVCDSCTARGGAMSWFAIAALANATGPEFGEHMPILMQVLDSHPLSPISLGVISDICHVLEGKMLPHCDKIMQVLYKGLSKSTLRAPIFSCFGDIALAISNDFEKYLQYVLEKLQEAANSKDWADVLEEDKIEYVNQIRQGICKAYSGILRGIKDPKIGFKVATHLFKFMEAVWVDRSRDRSVMHAAVAVLTDFHLTIESWTEEMTEEGMHN